MPSVRDDRHHEPAHGHATEYLVPFPVPDLVRQVEKPRNEGGFCWEILRKLLLGYLDSNQEQLKVVWGSSPLPCRRRKPRVFAVLMASSYRRARAGAD
jgi:hypothetical protein